MNKLWQDEAWADYLYWQQQDRKTLKRINLLLQDVDRNGYTGIGKPEPLRGDLSGLAGAAASTMPTRLVYRIRDGRVEIAQCRTHYGN